MHLWHFYVLLSWNTITILIFSSNAYFICAPPISFPLSWFPSSYRLRISFILFITVSDPSAVPIFRRTDQTSSDLSSPRKFARTNIFLRLGFVRFCSWACYLPVVKISRDIHIARFTSEVSFYRTSHSTLSISRFLLSLYCLLHIVQVNRLSISSDSPSCWFPGPYTSRLSTASFSASSTVSLNIFQYLQNRPLGLNLSPVSGSTYFKSLDIVKYISVTPPTSSPTKISSSFMTDTRPTSCGDWLSKHFIHRSTQCLQMSTGVQHFQEVLRHYIDLGIVFYLP